MRQVDPVEGYETLWNVLLDAFEQASKGKGKERHAKSRPFDQQPIITIGRETGPGGTVFQVKKKSGEALGMITRGQFDAAERELLGAINYAAATILLVRELAAAEKKTDLVDFFADLRYAQNAPPIPTHLEYDPVNGCFVENGIHQVILYGEGSATHDMWFDRRQEFPEYSPPVQPGPIPEDMTYDPVTNQFVTPLSTSGHGFYGAGSGIHTQWFARRGEFPTFTPAAPELPWVPVPRYVWYNPKVDRFVGCENYANEFWLEGSEFYAKWIGRKNEFPEVHENLMQMPLPASVKFNNNKRQFVDFDPVSGKAKATYQAGSEFYNLWFPRRTEFQTTYL